MARSAFVIVEQIHGHFIRLRCLYALTILLTILALLVWYQVYQPHVAINASLVPVIAQVVALTNNYQQCSYNEAGCDRSQCSCWSHYITVTFTALAQPAVLNNNPQTVAVLVTTDLYPSLNLYWSYWLHQTNRIVIGDNITGYYNICPLSPLERSQQLACAQHGQAQAFYWDLADDQPAYIATFFLVALAMGLLSLSCYYHVRCCWLCCVKSDNSELDQVELAATDHITVVVEPLPAYCDPESPPDYDCNDNETLARPPRESN